MAEQEGYHSLMFSMSKQASFFKSCFHEYCVFLEDTAQ